MYSSEGIEEEAHILAAMTLSLCVLEFVFKQKPYTPVTDSNEIDKLNLIQLIVSLSITTGLSNNSNWFLWLLCNTSHHCTTSGTK